MNSMNTFQIFGLTGEFHLYIGSPNKVLQSIKKCVMRLALVRPNISFKIVDIERYVISVQNNLHILFFG